MSFENSLRRSSRLSSLGLFGSTTRARDQRRQKCKLRAIADLLLDSDIIFDRESPFRSDPSPCQAVCRRAGLLPALAIAAVAGRIASLGARCEILRRICLPQALTAHRRSSPEDSEGGLTERNRVEELRSDDHCCKCIQYRTETSKAGELWRWQTTTSCMHSLNGSSIDESELALIAPMVAPCWEDGCGRKRSSVQSVVLFSRRPADLSFELVAGSRRPPWRRSAWMQCRSFGAARLPFRRCSCL